MTRHTWAVSLVLLSAAWLASVGPANAQNPAAGAVVRLNEDHRLQTSLWYRCYAQSRPDAHELMVRMNPRTRSGTPGGLITERSHQQREAMWKEAVEAARRSLRFARGEEPAGMNAFRQLGQRQPYRASNGPIDAQTAEVAQQTAVLASARLLALSNQDPKTVQSVSKLLEEVISRSDTNASQEAACMLLVVDNMAGPRSEDENAQRLLAILRMRPEVLQVHPMYGRAAPRRSAQPLSCAIGLHLVTNLMGQGKNVEARRLASQILGDVRGSIGRVDTQRVMPMQLDCGYFLLVAGNMEMLGIGAQANPVLANELYGECQAFIDACALNSAALQLSDQVAMTSRETVARTLIRIQSSAYPEVAQRARQLLAANYSTGERANAAMSPLERTFWQFMAVGAAIHAACQADEDCRKRAASISSGSAVDDDRQRDAETKRQNAHYEGMLRAGREDAATGGKGNLTGCYMSEAFCSSRF